MSNWYLQFDFAALKKAMPTHSALIDSLQKQYEAVKIPYGEIPVEHNKVHLIVYKGDVLKYVPLFLANA